MVHNLEDLFWFILTACKVSTHIFAYSFVVCVNYKCMNYYQYCGFSLLNISIEENQLVRRVKHLFEFARLSFNFEISDKWKFYCTSQKLPENKICICKFAFLQGIDIITFILYTGLIRRLRTFVEKCCHYTSVLKQSCHHCQNRC